MKKKILIGAVVLILLCALGWFFTRNRNADTDTDASSGDETTQDIMDSEENNTDISQNSTEDAAQDGAADVSEDDPEGGETDLSEEDGESVSGNDPVEAEAETVENAVSEEGVIYRIETSAGNSLGMVPIVNGSAVVLMDGSYASTYQGDYSPEETSALSLKVDEVSTQAAESGSIKAWAFYRDTALKTYEFPEGVTTIEKFAFSRSSLSSVVIPDGVAEIGSGAFYHCDSLLEVIIPDSVTMIEENAFAHTPWLDNWMAGGNAAEMEEEAEEGLDASESMNDSDFLIVGDGILLAYRGNEADPELPDGVKSVAPGVFGE